MKFIVKRYFSGYCAYEIDAGNEDLAYKKAKNLPINSDEILGNLEEWEECNEIEDKIKEEQTLNRDAPARKQ
jgi:hypothetical protein